MSNPINRAIIFDTIEHYHDAALAVLSEYSKVDLLYDQDGLLITSVATPILSRPSRVMSEKGLKQTVMHHAEMVIEYDLFAQYNDQHMAVLGYLSIGNYKKDGKETDPKAQEERLKRILLNAIKTHWNLFQKGGEAA